MTDLVQGPHIQEIVIDPQGESISPFMFFFFFLNYETESGGLYHKDTFFLFSRRRYSPRRRSSPSGYHSHHQSPRRRPWSPPRNRKTGVGLPGRNLFVAGFSFLTTERDLERKFSRFGRVRDVRIVRDKR